jgi:hypothetical protein
MSLTVTHPFVSLVADSGNTSLVQPSNWNDDHTVVGDATATTGYVLVGQGAGAAPIWSSSFPSIITFPDGTVGAPGIAFTDQTTTGFYRIGSGNVGLSLAGTLRYNFAATSFGLTSTTAINWASGDVTLTHATDTLTLSGDTLASLVFAHSGTKAATSTTSASATFAGGVGVAGALFTGSTITVNNQTATSVVTTLAVNQDWSPTSGFNLIAGFTSYGDASRFVIQRANGSQASPSQVLANDVLMQFGARGWHSGGAFGLPSPAAFNFIADENFTSTAWGTKIFFFTTAQGSTSATNRMCITHDGGINIGTTSGTSPGAGVLKIYTTTASTSTTTGALVVAGGVGVAGAVFLGTNLSIGATSFGTNANNVIGLLNGTAPTTSPANTGQLYVLAGALVYRGSGGTVTTVAPA